MHAQLLYMPNGQYGQYKTVAQPRLGIPRDPALYLVVRYIFLTATTEQAVAVRQKHYRVHSGTNCSAALTNVRATRTWRVLATSILRPPLLLLFVCSLCGQLPLYSRAFDVPFLCR